MEHSIIINQCIVINLYVLQIPSLTVPVAVNAARLDNGAEVYRIA